MSVFDTLSFRETLLGEEVSDNEAEKKIKSIDFSMTIFFFFWNMIMLLLKCFCFISDRDLK